MSFCAVRFARHVGTWLSVRKSGGNAARRRLVMRKGLLTVAPLILLGLLVALPADCAEGQQKLRGLDGTSVKPGADGSVTILTAEEVTKLTPIACLHVARMHTVVYRDAEGLWQDGRVNAGTLPVLERLPNGVVKTVWMPEFGARMKQYRVVYVRAENLAENWGDTQWAKRGGWSRTFSWAPDLCPMVPASAPPPGR